MSSTEDRPRYDRDGRSMLEYRRPIAQKLCRQVLDTTAPFLDRPTETLSVLDVGCGYGHTAFELSKVCRKVVGLEPSAPLATFAEELARDMGAHNLTVQQGAVEDLADLEAYDLVVLDTVFEHIPHQARGLANIGRSLKPGGVIYMVCPNKLWPIEQHYSLPFLSYLPLPWANRYLRWSGRGTDYEDASYAPTLAGLRRLFRARPELDLHLVTPADVGLTMAGGGWHYRFGVALLERLPVLWWIAKSFLVVAVKRPS